MNIIKSFLIIFVSIITIIFINIGNSILLSINSFEELISFYLFLIVIELLYIIYKVIGGDLK